MQLGNEGDDRGNVEDRRGFQVGGIHLGLGGLLVVGVLSLVFRTDLFSVLGQGAEQGQPGAPAAQTGPQVDQRKQAEQGLEKIAVGSFNDVQKLMGISGKVEQAQQRDPSARNALSVKLELQADCFAGVWGHSAAQRKLLDPGDTEQGLRAAASVGDDRIQKMAGRRVSPESFTHGSAEQRSSWFKRGLDKGDPKACDTFAE